MNKKGCSTYKLAYQYVFFNMQYCSFTTYMHSMHLKKQKRWHMFLFWPFFFFLIIELIYRYLTCSSVPCSYIKLGTQWVVLLMHCHWSNSRCTRYSKSIMLFLPPTSKIIKTLSLKKSQPTQSMNYIDNTKLL